MRLSTAGMHRNSIDAILEHQFQRAKTQQQITTGKKFQTAAEDPIGATRAAVLDRTMADNAQYGRNSNIIESRLNYEEQSLADATSLLQAARDLALGGANSTLGITGVNYQGDLTNRQIRISGSQSLADGHSGADVFMNIPEGNGVFSTTVGTGNTGTGTIDAGRVTDQSSWIADNYRLQFTT